MSERFLRMLVFFDLPTETKQDRREYARFRRFLIKNGFIMLQESVYCKLLLHATAQHLVLNALYKNKRLCTAVQKEIAEIARYELSTELFSLYAHLQEVLAEAVYRSGLDLEYDEIDDINGILKLCDLRPALPKATLCEKLLLYMELCAKYLKKQLFIILHLHVLLSAEEIKSFCKNAVYRKLPILLLEGARAEFSEQESVHIVDDDLCEI